MNASHLRTILISLVVTYLALTQHIFQEKAVLRFLFEHLLPILIGLLLATVFYLHRYGIRV